MTVTLEALASEVKKLKEQVAANSWAKDHLEIWKLMSLYSHLYYIGQTSKVPSLFAQKTPGVRLEVEDSGVYEGLESVTRFWTEVFNEDIMSRVPGWLAIHMTCNPVLEINRDGTKAKGIWHSHGFVSMVQGETYKQNLCLGKYVMEYVKEDAMWKIYHFNYRIAFMCSLEKGWVEEPVVASIAGNPNNRPDKPVSYHMPYSRYRINTMEPGPPEPYDD